eukprot:scaffold18345_cov53-Phaeocystis_antarctica.AAC.2
MPIKTPWTTGPLRRKAKRMKRSPDRVETQPQLGERKRNKAPAGYILYVPGQGFVDQLINVRPALRNAGAGGVIGEGDKGAKSAKKCQKCRKVQNGTPFFCGSSSEEDVPAPSPSAAVVARRAVDYYPPTDLEEDLEAGFMGLPFTQPETEHEWEDQINWDELERETVD